MAGAEAVLGACNTSAWTAGRIGLCDATSPNQATPRDWAIGDVDGLVWLFGSGHRIKLSLNTQEYHMARFDSAMWPNKHLPYVTVGPNGY